MTECQFEALDQSQIPMLNHFLKQNRQPTAGRGDWNFWIKQQGNIIAVARLIPIDGNFNNGLWLRGVFVLEAYRHQGIGKQLMQRIHQNVEKRVQLISQETDQACSTCIYAFPHGHLNEFYTPLGYKNCLPETLPTSLQKRFNQAKNNAKDWLCMYYEVKC
ncbi:MAG: GNAT family N-acetyltransferase [Pseudomonadota bacterium]|nr:GNAT family N-acetyltransferase [Pseudomonadota bacterium]